MSASVCRAARKAPNSILRGRRSLASADASLISEGQCEHLATGSDDDISIDASVVAVEEIAGGNSDDELLSPPCAPKQR